MLLKMALVAGLGGHASPTIGTLKLSSGNMCLEQVLKYFTKEPLK
jgi:hypothetical protein